MPDTLVSTLISSIKFEARLNATSEYDSWILEVLNEELLSLYAKHNYSENLEDVTLTCVAGVGYIDLPANYVRMPSNVRLKLYDVNADQSYSFLDPATNRRSQYSTGFPRFYEVKRKRLYIYPYTETTADHRIDLQYYKSPDALTTSSAVQSDWANTIKHKAIARLLLQKDSKSAAVHMTLAQDKFTDTV